MDGILARFLYTKRDISKKMVAATINHESKRTTNSSNYLRREQQINSSFYENLNKKILEFQSKKFQYNRNLVGVDGTRSHVPLNMKETYEPNPNGDSITVLILGVFDITRSSVISYDMRKDQDERAAFEDFLEKNDAYLNENPNTIFLLDRGFYSEDLVEFCNKKGINYIFRLKKNSSLLDGIKEKEIKVENKVQENEQKIVINETKRETETTVYEEKKKRGRPKKTQEPTKKELLQTNIDVENKEQKIENIEKKIVINENKEETETIIYKEKRGRGRPKKIKDCEKSIKKEVTPLNIEAKKKVCSEEQQLANNTLNIEVENKACNEEQQLANNTQNKKEQQLEITKENPPKLELKNEKKEVEKGLRDYGPGTGDVTVKVPFNNETYTARVIAYTYDASPYYLLTNILDKNVTIAMFADMYHDRWSHEEHYKTGKKCMKLDHLFDKTHNGLNKSLQAQICLHHIASIMEQELRRVKKTSADQVLNKVLLFDGIYKLLLDLFLKKNKITGNYLKNFFINFFTFKKKVRGLHNPRKGNIPFTKWYTKYHISKSKKKSSKNDYLYNLFEIKEDEETDKTENQESSTTKDNNNNSYRSHESAEKEVDDNKCNQQTQKIIKQRIKKDQKNKRKKEKIKIKKEKIKIKKETNLIKEEIIEIKHECNDKFKEKIESFRAKNIKNNNNKAKNNKTKNNKRKVNHKKNVNISKVNISENNLSNANYIEFKNSLINAAKNKDHDEFDIITKNFSLEECYFIVNTFSKLISIKEDKSQK